ncbi:MAG: glycosyltransferase [Bacteroidetes bacterium]|nr:glycosyltransferase [Bacteroidota bacterium]MBS1736025.1 glycosyltransferase [Bacteroidota bacterium]MBS1744599.1 glycosyltransferase [Bacteroidota bacterium]
MNNLPYWLITTEYPPHKGGGIGTYCFETARMLSENGYSVTVFIYDLSLSGDQVTIENNIRIVRFMPDKTKTDHFLGFNASLSYEYAYIINSYLNKEGMPAILESQEYLGIAYYIQQFKFLKYELFKDLKILITCHAPSFICLEYNHIPVYQFPDYWIGQMEKSVIRSADILISPSKYFVNQARQRMPWNGIAEFYIPNPISIGSSAPVTQFQQNYIVCFGKLSPLKGTFELLKYFKTLWDGGFKHPLHIIGGIDQIFHPDRLKMSDWVNRHYQKYVNDGLLILHGEYDFLEARKRLSLAHVVIVPSLFDNLPYTVLEAMGAGKIVLASLQGGQSEVIENGKNGFLFDHNTDGDFNSKLLEILDLSTAEINVITENAIRTIEKEYSYAAIFEKKKVLLDPVPNNTTYTEFPFLHPYEKPIFTRQTELQKQELLSVIIPYYNMGLYIEECIQSVLSSDYPNKEIIIVDDGSYEEKSITVLQEIESNYPVKIIRKKNEGLPKTRNQGAKSANGQYIAFLDADDTVEKTYYSKAIRVLRAYENVFFAGCWTKYFGDSNNSWPTFNPEPPYLLLHNMVNSSSLVYKHEAILEFGLNDKSFVYGMEDWDSVINMVGNNCGGIVLPERLFNYRVRKGSMARNFTRVKRLYLHFLIARKHSKLYEKHASAIVNLLQANGSSLNFDNPTLDLPGSFYLPFLPGKWQEKLKQRVKRNKFLKTFAYSIYKKVKK